ncbi:MAG: prephenate/arogenate dehydrogenase [Microcoleaceae cyanobacterium]
MKIGIVGLGLIGGSIGLEFSTIRRSPDQFSARFNPLPDSVTDFSPFLESFLASELIGVSRRQLTCERAVELGIVDTASTDLANLQAADVIFLCPPIGLIVPTLEQLVPILKPTTIVTDVGSVKQPIVAAANSLWPNFVGGHPMAGTAEQGIEAALLNLFVGQPYVITPTETTAAAAVSVVTALAHLLGATVMHCPPSEHDQAVAWISHLPVMVSASLITASQTEESTTTRQLAYQLASSGFRDTSRVGGGNPELGTMMAQYNRSAVLKSLYAYRQTLDQLIEQIEQENWPNLNAYLNQTQQQRTQFRVQ